MNIELPGDSGTIHFGIGAMLSPEYTFSLYIELIDYLEDVTGLPFNIYQKRTYNELNLAMRKGDISFALVCTGPYVSGRDYLKVLCVPVVDGSPTYRSLIITGKDITAGDFYSLEHRSFAFTDPLSFTGYFYPVSLIKAKGKTPDVFFSKTIYSGYHDHSIMAVKNGIVDAASVDSLIYNYFKETDPKLVSGIKVIQRSPPFGIPPVVASRASDPQLKRIIRDTLCEMHMDEKGKKILDGLRIDRFEIPPPGLYKNSVELIDKIQIH